MQLNLNTHGFSDASTILVIYEFQISIIFQSLIFPDFTGNAFEDIMYQLLLLTNRNY